MMFDKKEYREAEMIDVMREVHSLLSKIKTNDEWTAERIKRRIDVAEALDKKVVKVLESYGRIVVDDTQGGKQ